MSLADASPPVLAVRDLTAAFRTETGWFDAISGVSLSVRRGETVALVGESGSGKSVTGMSVMRLLPASGARIGCGQILFRGRDGVERDLRLLGEPAMRRLRGDEIAMIFQEPMTSLNPTQTAGQQIAEVLRLHRKLRRRQAAAEAIRMLDLVEIADARLRADSYPHQMSGGMRQRVMIAMALACRPSLLLADEPTTALDVTVQSQILRLIRTLQDEIGMGVLFITHDIGVVAEIADRVEVMYGGQVVESAPVRTLFDASRHPYTRGLMASLPQVGRAAGGRRRLPMIAGVACDPRAPPPGCRFAPRCGLALPDCVASPPDVARVSALQQTRCLRWRELA